MNFWQQAQNWKSLSIGFLLCTTLAIFFEQFWVLALPVLILLIIALLYKLDYYYYSLFLLVPLSMQIDDIGMGLGLSLPTEPLIFSLAIFFILKVLFQSKALSPLIKHPISYLILAYLAWMLVCVVFSTMPGVSLKFWISKVVYVSCFYFLGMLVMRSNPFKSIETSWWLYLGPLLGVIIYTLVRHTLYAYDEKAAHWVMQPFFKDHTIYGAILAYMLPFMVYVSFKKQKDFNRYLLFSVLLLTFVFGFIFSYTRAAWISVLGAFVLYLILFFRVKWYVITGLAMGCAVVLMLNWEQLLLRLEKNKQDSSGDLVEHVQSISNIASDASNLERLNRWNSAFKMFKEKPIVGFGPGTYMFQYAPYQQSTDLTIISTNFGDGGNAHSEYLGPLAEMGVFGFVFMLLLVLFMVYYAIVNYYYYPPKERKMILVILLGFVSYAAHGILNNYLDTDKAAVLFWTSLAFVATLDLQRKTTLSQITK